MVFMVFESVREAKRLEKEKKKEGPLSLLTVPSSLSLFGSSSTTGFSSPPGEATVYITLCACRPVLCE